MYMVSLEISNNSVVPTYNLVLTFLVCKRPVLIYSFLLTKLSLIVNNSGKQNCINFMMTITTRHEIFMISFISSNKKMLHV